MGSAVSLGEQGPQEEREFDSFYERARCGWSARGVRGAWEARSETDAGVSLLGSSVRSLGCARWAESDMHHPPPSRPPCCPRPVHARARRFSAPVPSRPGGCRRLPGDFFGPASCPSRARCGPSVAGKPSRTHGEPPGGTVAGLTMRGPGLQAGEEDLPGKVPGEFSSPSVCRPAWKMLRWGESRGRTSQQPVWLILPGPPGPSRCLCPPPGECSPCPPHLVGACASFRIQHRSFFRESSPDRGVPPSYPPCVRPPPRD